MSLRNSIEDDEELALELQAEFDKLYHLEVSASVQSPREQELKSDTTKNPSIFSFFFSRSSKKKECSKDEESKYDDIDSKVNVYNANDTGRVNNIQQLKVLFGSELLESQIQEALDAANGNPDLAYEFLLNGIPEEYLIKAIEFKDCKTIDEKIRWLSSDHGQQVLSQRPLLNEFYINGRIFRMIKDPLWEIRLNEWLQVHPDKKPYGLNLPDPIAKEKRKNKTIWLHKPHQNPPLHILFAKDINNSKLALSNHFPVKNKYDLLIEGFTIFPNIIPREVLEEANIAINGMLSNLFIKKQQKREASKSAKEKLRDDEDDSIDNNDAFTSGISNDKRILALFYSSPIFHLVQSILYGQRAATSPLNQKTYCGGAQVAFRFSQPRGYQNRSEIGGASWHLDGMDKSQYSPFSLLIGVALNDQLDDFSGNLCLHPGSHHTLQSFVKRYAEACDARDKLSEGFNPPGPVNIPRPDLGEPEQVKMTSGSVVFVLHKTAHLGGPNYSDQVRKMIYFRVSHVQHGEMKAKSLENIWIEFEGMSEVLS